MKKAPLSSNKRIAKNTMMLYMRMLLTMAVSLYTSRVVLNTLGVSDFGIYNIVAGFVTMFSFLNSAMASATQRFLSFEIGREDSIQLSNVFSMSINIHFLIAFVILIFSETIGLWFINTQLTIPVERMVAARWVYQFSILMLVINIVSVPYNAMIIAHERMNVFAWISILEVSLKLLVVFMLDWFGFDKLKLYAVLMFIVSLIIRLIYGTYCNHKFKESKYKKYWNKSLFKTLTSFAGWNLWGSGAHIMWHQGTNILLNIFFGPVVNAAYAITIRIQGAITSFVANFQMAMNPQIIKSYAADNLKYMHQLIIQGAKLSFFLILVLSLPILLETKIILELWLKTVPEHTAIFTQLIIINILIGSTTQTAGTAIQATGYVKLYQAIVGGLLLLNIPISYLFLRLGYEPQVTFYVSIVLAIAAVFIRILIMKYQIKIKFSYYLYNVIIKLLVTTFISALAPYLLTVILDESYARLLITLFASILSTIITIFFIGLNKKERKYLIYEMQKIKTQFTQK